MYKKTSDLKWFKYFSYVFLTYLYIDLCLDINTGMFERAQYILHHVLSIFFTLWGITYNFGIDNMPLTMYTFLITESSTFFLNFNILIKKYLDFTSNNEPTMLTYILEKMSVLNYVFFIPLFIYTRIYKCFSEVMFNPDCYNILLSPRNDSFYYLNRCVVLFLFVFASLNVYWLYLIFKNTYKKLSNFFKSRSEPEEQVEKEEERVEEENVEKEEEKVEKKNVKKEEEKVEKENVKKENVDEEKKKVEEQVDKEKKKRKGKKE